MNIYFLISLMTLILYKFSQTQNNMFNKSFLSKELAMLLLQQIFLMNRQYSASSVLDHEKYSLVRKSFLIIHLISLFFLWISISSIASDYRRQTKTKHI